MQTVPVSINSKPYQNVDAITLNDQSAALFDGYIDELGNSNARPGLLYFAILGSHKTVDGGYWWDKMGVIVVVSDGILYSLNESATVTTLSNATDRLLTTGRPTFADNGVYLVAANGSRIIYTDGTAGSGQYIASSDAPIQVTHVAFLDGWLIVNEVGSARFHYADFTMAPTVWFAINVYTAESLPDDVIALYVLNRIIVLIGNRSIEFWFNDGVSPFSRLEGSITSRGGMAPYSNVAVNEVLFLFDDRRRLISISGTYPQMVNSSFEKTIQHFDTVSDCIMDYMTILGRHLLIATFPTEKRTLFYDLQQAYWGEWSYWDSALSTRTRFLANCYVYAKAWNKHLVGSFQDDTILQITPDTNSDNGRSRHFSKLSGFIDHGQLSKRKRVYKLTVRLKTGTGIGAGGNTVPYARIRWTDVFPNGTLATSNWRYIPLLAQGDRGFLFTMTNLGAYYARQYEIECSENVPFILSECMETLDINEF